MITLAIASATALATAVVTDVVVARRHRRISRALLIERKLITAQLDKLHDLMDGKPARISPKGQIVIARNHLRRLRAWAGI
jgi:hypothetical protein